MKDSSFLQPVTQAGPTTSISKPQRAYKPDSEADPAHHQDAASEFNKQFDKTQTTKTQTTTTQADKTSEDSSENKAANSNEADIKLDPDMASIESGIWKFPEGTNPFERVGEELNSKEVETNTSEDVAVLSTIKAEAPVRTDVTALNIEDLIYALPENVEDIPLPEELESQALLQTIKSEDPDSVIESEITPEIKATESDIYIVQTQAAQTSSTAIIKETIETLPPLSGITNARSGLSTDPIIEETDLSEVEIEASDVDIDGAIDLADMDIQLPKEGNQTTQPNIFPNSAQTSGGQPIIGLGGELAAPTVFSGTTSVTNATPVTTTIPPAVQSAIISTVSDAILTAKETPKGVMVQLDPPEMGRVYIDFMFDADNRVNVVVKADNIDSFNILKERSQDFLQMLSDNGFSNVDLSFEQQSSSDGSSENSEDAQSYGVSYTEAAQDSLETSYRSPLYRVNEDELRLDLRL